MKSFRRLAYSPCAYLKSFVEGLAWSDEDIGMSDIGEQPSFHPFN